MKEILIIVDDKHGGFGDFLFGLKLSQKIQQIYSGQRVSLISGLLGIAKIKTSRTDEEFATQVLSVDEAVTKLGTGEMELGMVFICPVHDTQGWLHQIGAAAPAAENIPLYYLWEYNYMERPITSAPSPFVIKSIIKCGLGADAGGIFLDHYPSVPAIEKVDEKIQKVLFSDLGIESYFTDHCFSMGYFANLRPDFAAKYTLKDFISLHYQLSLRSDKKYHDILVVSSQTPLTIALIRGALRSKSDRFEMDGFSKILLENADTKAQTILLDNAGEGKVLRVVITTQMTHQSMMACTQLSGPIQGCTGDQSFGETVSAGKIVIYETLDHKHELIRQFDLLLIEKLKDKPELLRLVALLRNFMDIDELAALLTPENQARISRATREIAEEYDLSVRTISKIFDEPSREFESVSRHSMFDEEEAKIADDCSQSNSLL